MVTLTVTPTCLTCGTDVELVSLGRVVGGREQSAILRCAEGHENHLSVRYAAVDKRDEYGDVESACGSPAGYKRHRRHGEQACVACLAANSANVQRGKAKARERAGAS